jgi:2,4-dienoyl-CoA reductase-like NADH-dependent reductase (Old Yellow Enzyme family)
MSVPLPLNVRKFYHFKRYREVQALYQEYFMSHNNESHPYLQIWHVPMYNHSDVASSAFCPTPITLKHSSQTSDQNPATRP